MNQPATATRLRMSLLPRFCALTARVLILLSAVLLAITPMTAHFWTFDRFLRGGQDFEMGLLSLLAMLCLVLLLADSFRETISLLIALRKWLSYRYRREQGGAGRAVYGFRAAASLGSPPERCVGAFQLPLLI